MRQKKKNPTSEKSTHNQGKKEKTYGGPRESGNGRRRGVCLADQQRQSNAALGVTSEPRRGGTSGGTMCV